MERERGKDLVAEEGSREVKKKKEKKARVQG